MDKDRELSKLKNTMLKFNKNFPGKNLVFSDGNKDAKVMIVGRLLAELKISCKNLLWAEQANS